MYSCSLSISSPSPPYLFPASSIALIFSSFPVSLYFELCLRWDVPTFVRRQFCVQVPHGYVGKSNAFYLCGKGKSECQYLRLYIISQLIFLFHREQDDIFQHTCIQYTHYFHQSSSQTRDLRHNQCIPFLYSFQ